MTYRYSSKCYILSYYIYMYTYLCTCHTRNISLNPLPNKNMQYNEHTHFSYHITSPNVQLHLDNYHVIQVKYVQIQIILELSHDYQTFVDSNIK